MTSRDWRVDSLRGYFLVLMTLAHLPQHPLQRFSSYTFGYASAPDGFVFLSGLVSTWVYLRVRNKHGQHALEARVLRRTRDVYLVHIVLLSASIGGAVLLNHTSFPAAHPVQTFVSGSLLLYQPTLSDILPMYCVFLLFTPLVLDQPGNIQHSGVAGVLRCRPISRIPEPERRRGCSSEVTSVAGGLCCGFAAFFPGPPQPVHIRSDAAAEILHWPQPDSSEIPGRGLPGLCDLVDSADDRSKADDASPVQLSQLVGQALIAGICGFFIYHGCVVEDQP